MNTAIPQLDAANLKYGENRLLCPSCSPQHHNNNRTLSVKRDAEGIVWHCFRCGLSGGNPSENYPLQKPAQLERAARRTDQSKLDYAMRLWSEARAIDGTLAQGYLASRGIRIAACDALRFHPTLRNDQAEHPALVALMSDPLANKPVGIHRTFLAADGKGKAKAGLSKMMLGSQGVIRLSADDEVTTGLNICEGIEDGLSLLQMGFAPVWVCGSAGSIRKLPVLAGIEALTIWADPDHVGQEAATVCGRRFAATGIEVSIKTFKRGDWNDLLKEVA